MRLYEIVVEYHKTLNPKLWKGMTMKTEVRDQLIEIAETFIEFLEIDTSYIEDVTMTGSNCNYNWTATSDIDLHVIVNYEKFQQGCEVADVAELFSNKKTVWNDSHDITIYDIPIELYVQDTAGNRSPDSTVFSIKENSWIKTPTKYEKIDISQKEIDDNFNELKDRIEKAMKGSNLDEVNKLKEFIANTRTDSLAKEGEFSLHNLVYKKLKRAKIMDKLYQHAIDLENKELSL